MNTNPKNTSFEEATGKIPYNMTNDYMFRAVLQENETVLRGADQFAAASKRQRYHFRGNYKSNRTWSKY